MEMEIIRTLFLLLLSTLILLLPCEISSHNIGKTQQEALSHILEEKMMMAKNNDDAAIDRSHFNANHHHLRIDAKATTYPQDGMKEKDRIEKFPGQPSHVKFDQYGGYITINQTTGKAFYYYFVEAPRSDKPLPLLLWLNGGPGCSSLAYGAMQELGPFRVHSDGKTLYKNKYAWNHAANVLFLESPAGVGFSYSNTTSDYTIGGDKQTAKDNLIFLLNWFERFPEYKGRDFYISGESYAGHYVPQLAHLILYNNKNNAHHYINFKGILIGNALINDETDVKGMYEYFAGHALISDVTKDQIFKYCDFSPNATEQSAKCQEAAIKASRDLSSIYIFNIYAPWCSNTNLTDRPKKITGVSIDPCSDYYGIAYVNRADVQEAIHANVTKISYDWQPCSDVLTKWEDSPDTIIPLLQEFMENGLRVWIFSGDIDGRIPFTSTINSINVMNLPIKSFWHPWFFAGEVGGYTQVYEGNLTFATVRGAGHQVPSYQPERALSLVMHFLSGSELPAHDSS